MDQSRITRTGLEPGLVVAHDVGVVQQREDLHLAEHLVQSRSPGHVRREPNFFYRVVDLVELVRGLGDRAEAAPAQLLARIKFALVARRRHERVGAELGDRRWWLEAAERK